MKKCSKCGIQKPATTEYFGRHKSGLQSWCKECKRKDHLQNREQRNARSKARYRALHPKETLPEGFKRCAICNEIKQICEFGKCSKNKDGLRGQCKECRRGEYRANAEEVKAKRKAYYQENKNRVLAATAEYKKRHPNWYKEYNRRYYQENEERIKETVKRNHYRRIKEDVGYRLLQRCRKRLYEAVKGNVKSKRTIELIGCSVKKLMEHLESKFQDGMSWGNYGEWHVDHIKPCAMFDFSKVDQQKACFHYSNLQPLWAKENLMKSNKFA